MALSACAFPGSLGAELIHQRELAVSRIKPLVLATASLSLLAPVTTQAQSFPRLPNGAQPNLPDLRGARTSSSRSAGLNTNGSNGNELQNFMMDAQKLTVPIDTTTVKETDNERIDREVADYRALADRVASGRYDALPAAQREPMLFGLRTLYDGAAASVDQEIENANGMITGRGRADAAFNYLIALDAYLYAAENLFPDVGGYSEARGRLASAIDALGGSRSAARDTEDAAELAAARNVRMPAAVTSDPGVQALFRQAWGTSGIPWKIMKINVTSGWRDKVEYGRVIGQRRDAAIAARDPNNPERCNLYDFTMFRDRSGSVRRDSHSTTRIACENVK